MNKNAIVFSILFIGLSLISCTKRIVGTGSSVTKSYSYADFSGIDLSIKADVIYLKDTNYRVEVSAQQNVLDLLKIEKKNGKLCIGFKNFTSLIKHDPILISVSSPYFSEAEVSGSGSVKVHGNYESSNVSCSVSGSGSVALSFIKADQCTSNISGSGSVSIFGGTCNAINSNISGSGTLEATMLQSEVANTQTSGSGTTKIWVEKTLNASISGSGDVYYKGSPTILSHVSGSGKIIKL